VTSNRRDNRAFGGEPWAQNEKAVQRPEACPFCESKAVGTLAKVITISTYWRCQACGEMWNPQRLERTSALPRRGRSW
jgi:ribosomal protein L37AE/L43A